MLDKAISIAVKAHAGQLDKAGKPYILHPLHLMSKFLYCDELASIAVLHDVIEDSDYTLYDLGKIGFSFKIVTAIATLTHYRMDSYEEYIEEISYSKEATLVKIEDLKHNMDLSRLHTITTKDVVRVKKYHKALVKLTGE